MEHATRSRRFYRRNAYLCERFFHEKVYGRSSVAILSLSLFSSSVFNISVFNSLPLWDIADSSVEILVSLQVSPLQGHFLLSYRDENEESSRFARAIKSSGEMCGVARSAAAASTVYVYIWRIAVSHRLCYLHAC